MNTSRGLSHHYSSTTQLIDIIAEHSSACAVLGATPLIVCPTISEVNELKCDLGAHPAGFGVTVLPVREYLSYLWSLYGTGELLVDNHVRRALIAHLLNAYAPESAGFLNFYAEAFQKGFATLQEKFSEDTSQLSAHEQILINIAERYEALLTSQGFIELDCAIKHLQSLDDVTTGTLLINVNTSALIPRAASWLNQLPQATLDTYFSDDSPQQTYHPISAQTTDVFVSTGPRARLKSLTDALTCCIAGGARHIGVACAKPDELMHALCKHPDLFARELRLIATYRIDLTKTEVGQLLFSTQHMLDETCTNAEAADCMSLRLLGVQPRFVFKSDKIHQGDRLLDPIELFSDIANWCRDELKGFFGLFEEGNIIESLNVIKSFVLTASHLPEDWRARELKALEIFETIAQTIEALDLENDILWDVLENAVINQSTEVRIPMNATSGRAAAATRDAANTRDTDDTRDIVATHDVATNPLHQPITIEITSHQRAGAWSAQSLDAVIIADLDDAHISIAHTPSAAEALLAEYGLEFLQPETSPIQTQITRALCAARHHVFHRTLHDESADEIQPSALWSDLMALLDTGDAATPEQKSLCKTLSVPAALVRHAHINGEEDVLANVFADTRAQNCSPSQKSSATKPNQSAQTPTQASEQTPASSRTPKHTTLNTRTLNEITERGRDRIIIQTSPAPHIDTTPLGDSASSEAVPLLAASQIESFLECPYQWLAKRRLHAQGLSEGFGAIERGNFMHKLLEKFYNAYISRYGSKVTPDKLPEARELLQLIFRELVADQQFERPGHRWVAINPTEEKQQQRLLADLTDYLEFEAYLLPNFDPWKFEWEFGRKGTPVYYAGCALQGTVDRIDVDNNGRAVIIDYKSSLNAEYQLHDPKLTKPAPKSAAKASAKVASQPTDDATADPNEPAVFELPQKIQAIIYAQVVRELLGLEVVGALYINPIKMQVMGAYDARVLSGGVLSPSGSAAQSMRADILFRKSSDNYASELPYPGIASMDELLDTCEEYIARELVKLKSGYIPIDPISEHVCAHCPVLNCPARSSKQTNSLFS